MQTKTTVDFLRDVPCGLQFTSGKGKPYLACDKHKIEAILLKVHGDPRRHNPRGLLPSRFGDGKEHPIVGGPNE